MPTASAKRSVEPHTIIKQIEEQKSCLTDPYWARLDAMLQEELEQHGDDERDDARFLRQTTGGLTLETAARRVGFVLGYEHARRRGVR